MTWTESILRQMTCVELEMYAAIGGLIPPELEPRLRGVMSVETEWRPVNRLGGQAGRDPRAEGPSRRRGNPRGGVRPVVRIEFPDFPYESLNAAARAHGVNASSIFKAIRCGSRCSGFHWRFADQPPPCPAVPKESRLVVCVERPNLAPQTVALAAWSLGVSPDALTAAVRRGETIRNLTFVYLPACTPSPKQERTVA